MTTSVFRVWVKPKALPIWENVKISSLRITGADAFEIVVQGEGRDFEHVIREHPEVFVMFERVPGIPREP